MQESLKILYCVAVLSATISLASAGAGCDGYEYTLHSISNCGAPEENIIQVNTTGIAKSNGCQLAASGCANWKAFKAGKVSYHFTKETGTSRVKGSFDLCDPKNSNSFRAVFKSAGIPSSCPVQKGQRCSNGEDVADMSKHKLSLAMIRGRIKATVNIDHGAEGKSCFIVDVEGKKVQ